MLYYALFILFYQSGYGSSEVAHLSFIPCLTSLDEARIQLTSLRFAFRILSNILFYVVAFVLFRTSTSEETIEFSEYGNNISSKQNSTEMKRDLQNSQIWRVQRDSGMGAKHTTIMSEILFAYKR